MILNTLLILSLVVVTLLTLVKKTYRLFYLSSFNLAAAFLLTIYQANTLDNLYDNAFDGNTVKPFELRVYLGNLQIVTIFSTVVLLILLYTLLELTRKHKTSN